LSRHHKLTRIKANFDHLFSQVDHLSKRFDHRKQAIGLSFNNITPSKIKETVSQAIAGAPLLLEM
jgi:hypothetical protein